MKKKIGLFIILCIIIGICFWGYSIYRKYTCPIWNSSEKQCYQCDYQEPVYVGKIKAINRCSTRHIMQDCCETGFYSVPNNYKSPDGDFSDCKRFFNQNIFDLCPMYKPLWTTFQSSRSVIFILCLFSIIIFIPFWIIKKIRKKCRGYSVMKIIALISLIIGILIAVAGQIVDYVTRDIGQEYVPNDSIESITDDSKPSITSDHLAENLTRKLFENGLKK